MPESADRTPAAPGTLFGSALRRAREAARLSQEDLAERAGLSAKAIGALERGERRHPYPSTVRALTAALGLPEEERRRLALTVAPRGEHEAGQPALSRLPTPRVPLVGRQAELATIAALLGEDGLQLVTVTGAGGVGKTHLALAAAHACAGQFADGVVFVDLAPLRDPALALSAIAQALGVRQIATASPIDALIAYVRPRQLLLLIDNVEHLLPAAVDLARLLEQCPSLRVLATSRAPLRVRGEHLLPLLPLALPAADAPADPATLGAVESVALFVARARAANPGFILTGENAATVAALCRRLDGLPLALELAAARLRFLTVEVLLALLDVRLRELTAGERDRPPRHQTLRDAIAWSYDLLTPHEQALFRRLAVFGGGFTVSSAAWAASGAVSALHPIPDPLDRLGALVDQGLAAPWGGESGESRFRMLETVGEYAAERLAEHGETNAARDALAAWCQDFAAREGFRHLFHADLVRRRDAITAEHANLLAGLDHLASGAAVDEVRLVNHLGVYWATQGQQTLARARLERAVARAGEVPADAAIVAMGELALTLIYCFDLKACAAVVARAIALDAAHGGRYRHWLLHFQTSVAMFDDDPDAAYALAVESVVLSDLAGDQPMAAHCRLVQARLAVEGGALDVAEAACRRVLAEFPDSPYAEGGARLVFGWVASGRAQHALALREYVAALVAYIPVGDPMTVQPMLDGAAVSLAFLDRPEAAVRLFAAAERQRRDTIFHLRTPREAAAWAAGLDRARTVLGEERFAAAWRDAGEPTLGAAMADLMAEEEVVFDQSTPIASH